MYFEDLKKKMNEAITDYEKFLGSGGLVDYSSYRQHVGTIHGIKLCLDLVAQIQKQTADGEDN